MATWEKIRGEFSSYESQWAELKPALLDHGLNQEAEEISRQLEVMTRCLRRAEIAENRNHRLLAMLWSLRTVIIQRKLNSQIKEMADAD